MVARGTLSACLLLAAGIGCEGTHAKVVKDPPPLAVHDTGTACDVEVLQVTPESGATNVYWRDDIRVVFADYAAPASITLTSAGGVVVDTNLSWDDVRMNVRIVPADALEASTTYTVAIEGCGDPTSFEFTTGAWGSPLTIDVSELIGRVYNVDLAGADYEKPEGLGTLLGLYLTEPLLFQVTGVTETTITLMGAQGKLDGQTGEIVQNRAFRTWDFGTVSFADNPFFGATSPGIVIDYDGSVIPMHNFYVGGTFSEDGTELGGAMASGYGDTRDMGPLMQLGDDPDAVCDFAAGLGLECVACPDGNNWCLEIEAHFDDAEWLEGLDLVEVN